MYSLKQVRFKRWIGPATQNLKAASMKKKTLYLLFTVLVIVAGAVGLFWYIQMRPALPYLRLLSSGDRTKIFTASDMLCGVVSRGKDANGNLLAENIRGYQPLRGYARRMVARKVIEVLATTDDHDVIRSLLWASTRHSAKSFDISGADLYLITNAIDIANADFRRIGERFRFRPGRNNETYYDRYIIEEDNGIPVLTLYAPGH